MASDTWFLETRGQRCSEASLYCTVLAGRAGAGGIGVGVPRVPRVGSGRTLPPSSKRRACCRRGAWRGVVRQSTIHPTVTPDAQFGPAVPGSAWHRPDQPGMHREARCEGGRHSATPLVAVKALPGLSQQALPAGRRPRPRRGGAGLPLTPLSPPPFVRPAHQPPARGLRLRSHAVSGVVETNTPPANVWTPGDCGWGVLAMEKAGHS